LIKNIFVYLILVLKPKLNSKIIILGINIIMSIISIDDNIELQYDGTNFIYNSTNYSGPITITNTGNSQIVVSLNFSNSISNTYDYFIVGSNNITFDGQNLPINVSVTNYGGLIQNNDIYSNIIVQNIQINADDTGSLSNNSGWIISTFTHSPPSEIICRIYNCSSTGEIGTGCGGIIGASGYCEAFNCNSSGNISMFGGGIFGGGCVNCNAYNCYSIGNINTGGGGIFGSNTNFQGINLISEASNCFSTGSINNSNGIGSGGIFGSRCNEFSQGSQCIATNCYSIGNIGGINSCNNGGIFGYNCNFNSDGTCISVNCSSYGNIYGDESGANGGIYGSEAISCEARNCFSIGNIGYGSGGIFLSGDLLTASTCYTIGDIGESAGGILGPYITNGTAEFCYSIGDIGNNSGGIFGPNTTNSTANQCYSIGFLGTNAGGIFGDNSSSTFTNNCYVTSNLLIGPNALSTITNSMSENGDWNDTNANATIGYEINPWVSYTSNTPYILGSFNTNSQYFNYIACPKGYKYSYLIPNITTITENQSISLQVLIGYYIGPQDDPTIISLDIYGYVFNSINNGNLDINIEGGSDNNNNIANYSTILLENVKKPNL